MQKQKLICIKILQKQFILWDILIILLINILFKVSQGISTIVFAQKLSLKIKYNMLLNNNNNMNWLNILNKEFSQHILYILIYYSLIDNNIRSRLKGFSIPNK